MNVDKVYILEDRGVLYINGDDCFDFLQNLITNDLNKVSPAPSPVKGRPVLFAPFLPGANPTINFFELIDPNDLTGLLCQLGYSNFIDFL